MLVWRLHNKCTHLNVKSTLRYKNKLSEIKNEFISTIAPFRCTGYKLKKCFRVEHCQIAYEAIFNANKLIRWAEFDDDVRATLRKLNVRNTDSVRRKIDCEAAKHPQTFNFNSARSTFWKWHFYITVLLIMIASNVCLMTFGVCPNGHRFVFSIDIHASFASLKRNARALIYLGITGCHWVAEKIANVFASPPVNVPSDRLKCSR